MMMIGTTILTKRTVPSFGLEKSSLKVLRVALFIVFSGYQLLEFTATVLVTRHFGTNGVMKFKKAHMNSLNGHGNLRLILS